jgi:3-methyl-2-oxobutanoate hydroxymethyltransferase
MMIHHKGGEPRSKRADRGRHAVPDVSTQHRRSDAESGQLIQEGGASAVKIEVDRRSPRLQKRLVDIGVPVMGHLGLTPRSMHPTRRISAARARFSEAAERLMRDAELLEKSGVFAIVLESIPHDLAGRSRPV